MSVLYINKILIQKLPTYSIRTILGLNILQIPVKFQTNKQTNIQIMHNGLLLK